MRKNFRKPVFAGIICLVLGFVSQNANAKSSPEEIYLRGYEYYEAGNLSEAAKLFEKSAKKGYAETQFGLGSLYYSGMGVGQDFAKAVKWWKRAAENGHEFSKVILKGIESGATFKAKSVKTAK